jgi:hypothetical protein
MNLIGIITPLTKSGGNWQNSPTCKQPTSNPVAQQKYIIKQLQQRG